jgi:hypothetical protein
MSDNSDPEFVVWHLLAERDDGHVQLVRVKVDRFSFAEHLGTCRRKQLQGDSRGNPDAGKIAYRAD